MICMTVAVFLFSMAVVEDCSGKRKSCPNLFPSAEENSDRLETVSHDPIQQPPSWFSRGSCV